MPPLVNDVEIGARLRDARKAAGLSQAQVRQLTGLGQEVISNIENGTRSLKATEIAMFCELYQIGYDWLLGQFTECDLPDEVVAMAEKLPPFERRKLLAVFASYGNMY